MTEPDAEATDSAGADGRPTDRPAGGDRQRLAVVVSGRVQGVGFRRYVQRWARRLDLAGWVRNEPDGTVRVVADGPADAVGRLARLLWGGPPGARVDAVEAFDPADGAVPEEFEVRH